MSFNFENFVAEPSQEQLNIAKKTDLLELAKHYKLSQVKTFMRKQEIKNILIQHFVDGEIFDENALSLIVSEDSEIRLRQIELQYRLEEKRLENEREDRELVEREREKEYVEKGSRWPWIAHLSFIAICETKSPNLCLN